jgi:hypothetical protein
MASEGKDLKKKRGLKEAFSFRIEKLFFIKG